MLAHYFLQGNENEAVKYIDDLLTKYPKLYLFEDIITPAMYYIGELWEKNEISVAEEHLATGVCDYVLTRLDYWIQQQDPNTKKVVLLGAEKEQHYIGLKMVANYYREKGWEVRYLGPNLPTNHAIKLFNKWKPDIIGISAALTYRLPALKNSIETFRQLKWEPDILVGGRITKGNDLSSLEGERTHIIKSLKHLNQFHAFGEVSELDETS